MRGGGGGVHGTKIGCATTRKIMFWGEGVGKRYNTVRVRSTFEKTKTTTLYPEVGGWGW